MGVKSPGIDHKNFKFQSLNRKFQIQ
jgi:hypothetical protein